MNNTFYVIPFILSVFVSSCTQIYLKKSANKEHKGIYVYLNKTVIISNTIFVGVTLAIVILYRYIQLSTATLLNASSYIFILILSYLFLKEKISKNRIIGILFIIAGISVYAIFDGKI